MDFFIVAVYPNYFSWNNNLKCDNINVCTFKFQNGYLFRSSDNFCLSIKNNTLFFSKTLKTSITVENTNVKTNFRLKIDNKYIRHRSLKLYCEEHQESSDFYRDSTWIFIENKINFNHDIIISRYKENISWVRYLQGNVIVYNKGKDDIFIDNSRKNIKITQLDNIGREGHTYLYHIINNYDNLKDRITFLQGNPFEHSPNILELLCMENDFEDIQSLSTWYTENNIPPQNIVNKYLKNLNGALYSIYYIKNNMNIIDYEYDDGLNNIIKIYSENNRVNSSLILFHFLHRCKIKHKSKLTYKFIFSALFSIKKNNLLSNSVETYKNILNELLKNCRQGGQEGYILERLWYTIFEI